MRRPESNGPGVFSRRGCGDVDTRRGEVLWGHSGRRPSPSQGEKPLRRPALQTAWPCSSSLWNCESTPLQLQLPNLWRSAMKALTIQPLNLSDSTFLLSDFCSRLIIIYWKKCLDWDSNYACFIHSFRLALLLPKCLFRFIASPSLDITHHYCLSLPMKYVFYV